MTGTITLLKKKPPTLQYPACSWCGGRDVLADAHAEWSHSAQRWELQNTFDKNAFCATCDGETTIEWKEEKAGA